MNALYRYPRVSRGADELAAAVRALLVMADTDPGLSLELAWDMLENT
ncbi:hypothetical protein [Nocardia sp. SC052]